MRSPLPHCRLNIAALALLLTISLWVDGAKADGPIAGTYDAQGVNLGGKHYSGVVEIVKDGQTYQVLWLIERETIRGFGVATAKHLAVAFTDGVVLYERASEDTWCGIWTSSKGRMLGRESLTRQAAKARSTAVWFRRCCRRLRRTDGRARSSRARAACRRICS
jgi:hypothetical protein